MKIVKNNQNKQNYTSTIPSSIYPFGIQFPTEITHIPDRKLRKLRPGSPDSSVLVTGICGQSCMISVCNCHCWQCLRAVQLVPHGSEQPQDDSLPSILTKNALNTTQTLLFNSVLEQSSHL